MICTKCGQQIEAYLLHICVDFVSCTSTGQQYVKLIGPVSAEEEKIIDELIDKLARMTDIAHQFAELYVADNGQCYLDPNYVDSELYKIWPNYTPRVKK